MMRQDVSVDCVAAEGSGFIVGSNQFHFIIT